MLGVIHLSSSGPPSSAFQGTPSSRLRLLAVAPELRCYEQWWSNYGWDVIGEQHTQFGTEISKLSPEILADVETRRVPQAEVPVGRK